MGNSPSRFVEIKTLLNNKYKIENLRSIKCYLGVEFHKTKSGMFFNQSKYIFGMLKDQGMMDCKIASTPLPEGFVAQSITNTLKMDQTICYQIVGKLLYLTNT